MTTKKVKKVSKVSKQNELLAKEINKIKEGKSELIVKGLNDVYVNYDLSDDEDFFVVKTVKKLEDKLTIDIKCLMTKNHYEALFNKNKWDTMLTAGSLIIIDGVERVVNNRIIA